MYINYVIWKMFLPIYSAEMFHRRRVQKDFFLKWKKMAADRVMIRAADNLHCLHSLKKGMNAFKWAINRSKIMVDIYQNKLKGILVTATFFKVCKSIGHTQSTLMAYICTCNSNHRHILKKKKERKGGRDTYSNIKGVICTVVTFGRLKPLYTLYDIYSLKYYGITY